MIRLFVLQNVRKIKMFSCKILSERELKRIVTFYMKPRNVQKLFVVLTICASKQPEIFRSIVLTRSILLNITRI